MHRIDALFHDNGLWTGGTPGLNGADATRYSPEWMNDLQENITLAIEAAGITLVKGDYTQLELAIKLLAGQDFGFRNLFVNGNLLMWQRGDDRTITTADGTVFVADRWACGAGSTGAQATVSRQDFARGQTDVADAALRYLRWEQDTSAPSSNPFIEQRMARVNLLAQQPLVFTFWAKVDSGTVDVTPYYTQFFGDGGGADADNQVTFTPITIDTTWQRFEVKFTPDSIAGKSITTDNYMAVGFKWPTGVTFQADIANLQNEMGTAATRFENLDRDITFWRSQFWCQKSYEHSAEPGAATDRGALQFIALDDVQVRSCMQRFPATMRTDPIMKWYAPSNGAEGYIDWDLTTPRQVTATTGTSPDNTGYPTVSTSHGSTAYGKAHWLADAEFYAE